MNAEPARDVTGRRDDAAPARMADDERLLPDLGTIPLLDGRIERITVDMGDGERRKLRMRDTPRRAAGRALRLGGIGDLGTIAAQSVGHRLIWVALCPRLEFQPGGTWSPILCLFGRRSGNRHETSP